MKANVGQELTVPSEIACNSLELDLLLNSNSQCFECSGEHVAPWEDAVQSV